MAAEDGIGTWLAPYDQMSYLRPHAGDGSTDIPLLNVGVLVVPSRSVDASAYAAVSVPQVRNGRGNGKTDGDLLHATFNHRNVEALRRMPEFTSKAAYAPTRILPLKIGFFRLHHKGTWKCSSRLLMGGYSLINHSQRILSPPLPFPATRSSGFPGGAWAARAAFSIG